MEGGQIIDRNLGLISTFEVALPEGTVPLTIRHRSVSVEPAKSELFRLMGAAVWPAAIGTIQVVMDDSDLRQAAARGGRLLELGSGHGLAGLAAACLDGWKRVILTDKDTRLVDLIEENCRSNESRLPASLGGQISVMHCVWSHAESEERLLCETEGGLGFDLILAAGCTYGTEALVDSLFTTVRRLLAADGTAILVHQTRDLQNLYTGVSVRRTLKEEPQGFFRGSRLQLQAADVIAAIRRNHLILLSAQVRIYICIYIIFICL
jgi:predicted nicotinamide N-methyase